MKRPYVFEREEYGEGHSGSVDLAALNPELLLLSR